MGRVEQVRVLAARFERSEELATATACCSRASTGLQALADFVADERHCCSFAVFAVTVAPPYEYM